MVHHTTSAQHITYNGSPHGITTMLGVLNFHTSTMVYSTISVQHITYNGLPHGISTMRGVLDFAEVSQRFPTREAKINLSGVTWMLGGWQKYTAGRSQRFCLRTSQRYVVASQQG
jgi:hypothetical protein